MRIYRITTNPKRKEILLDLRELEDTPEKTGLSLQGTDYAETGYFPNVQEAEDWISKADLIFIHGEIDRTSCFELGLCAVLQKPVFLVSETGSVQGEDLDFFYPNLDIIAISLKSFAELLE